MTETSATETSAPVLKNIFGDDWHKLPRVFHRHYACRAGTDDTAVCEGVLDIRTSWLGRLLAPLFYLSGTLVPYAGTNIRAKVTFESAQKSGRSGMAFDRVFYFPGRKPYRFRSFLQPTGGNQITETTRLGLGWRAAFVWTGEKIDMQHRGYSLMFFGKALPFPAEWLIGRSHASETAIDDDRFAMTMDITHPLWGHVLGYSGIFSMTKDATP
ncbi:MAG: DUF4166 domain-containing protein [Alphaproteobacteria bacterium]|nr:DUF4166 domain-containing protein [Alphaproteobacteria bacterium]